MNFVPNAAGASSLARWTTRIAVFAIALTAVTLLLHRLLGMPTTVALNLFKLSFACAVAAIVIGLYASARIWRTGEEGVARVITGIVLSAGLLAWPLSQLPTVAALPAINDLTTNPADPPPFATLGPKRGAGANGADYPGDTFAKAQAAAYPDIQPLEIDRSSQEAFGLAADVLRNKMFMTIAREQPPDAEAGDPGFIEAEDLTLVMGFRDDVAIRVSGDETRSRIDVRSASRYGRHDLGRNAQRLRQVLRELVVRLEETVPAPKPQENVTLKSRVERADVKKRRVYRRKQRRRYNRYKPKFFFPY